MDWQVHYQSGDRVFSAPMTDRSTAIAIACILLRDGHHVVNLQSTTGETIETDHLKQVSARCAATPGSGRRIQGPVRSIAGNTLFGPVVLGVLPLRFVASLRRQ